MKIQKLVGTSTCAILFSFLLAGCMNIPATGAPFNWDNVGKLKVGQSTEKDVVEIIGQPSNTTRSSDGTAILTFMYIPGYRPNMIDPYAGTKEREANTHHLTIMIDSSGKVAKFTEGGYGNTGF